MDGCLVAAITIGHLIYSLPAGCVIHVSQVRLFLLNVQSLHVNWVEIVSCEWGRGTSILELTFERARRCRREEERWWKQLRRINFFFFFFHHDAWVVRATTYLRMSHLLCDRPYNLTHYIFKRLNGEGLGSLGNWGLTFHSLSPACLFITWSPQRQSWSSPNHCHCASLLPHTQKNTQQWQTCSVHTQKI